MKLNQNSLLLAELKKQQSHFLDIRKDINESTALVKNDTINKTLRNLNTQAFMVMQQDAAKAIQSLRVLEDELQAMEIHATSEDIVRLWIRSGLNKKDNSLIGHNNAMTHYVSKVIQLELDNLNNKYKHYHFEVVYHGESIRIIASAKGSLYGNRIINGYHRLIKLASFEIGSKDDDVNFNESDVLENLSWFLARNLSNKDSLKLFSEVESLWLNSWLDAGKSDMIHRANRAAQTDKSKRIYSPESSESLGNINSNSSSFYFNDDYGIKFFTNMVGGLKENLNHLLEEKNLSYRVKNRKKIKKELQLFEERMEITTLDGRIDACKGYLDYAEKCLKYFQRDSLWRDELNLKTGEDHEMMAYHYAMKILTNKEDYPDIVGPVKELRTVLNTIGLMGEINFLGDKIVSI